MDSHSTSKKEAQDANESTEVAPITAKEVAAVAETEPEMPLAQRHYSALAQMLAEVSQDHAQLRSFVYEYARIQLRKELYPQFLEGAWSEIEERMRGLEDAIDQLETDYDGSTPLPLSSNSGLANDAKAQSASTVGYFGTGGKARFGQTASRLVYYLVDRTNMIDHRCRSHTMSTR